MCQDEAKDDDKQNVPQIKCFATSFLLVPFFDLACHFSFTQYVLFFLSKYYSTNVRGRNDDDTFYAKMGERKGGKSLEKGKNAMQNRAGLLIENHNEDLCI